MFQDIRRILIAISRAPIHAVDTAVIYFLKENVYSHMNIYCTSMCRCDSIGGCQEHSKE
jgi:hypothetical protein